jgi:hypothetical protein
MARSRLPFVLLKTHVKTRVNAVTAVRYRMKLKRTRTRRWRALLVDAAYHRAS